MIFFFAVVGFFVVVGPVGSLAAVCSISRQVSGLFQVMGPGARE
jgi:hypothetical protein